MRRKFFAAAVLFVQILLVSVTLGNATPRLDGPEPPPCWPCIPPAHK